MMQFWALTHELWVRMVEYIFSNGTFIVICAKRRGNRILHSHVRVVNVFKGTVTSLIKSHRPSSLQPSFILWKRSETGPLLKGGCKGVSQAEKRGLIIPLRPRAAEFGSANHCKFLHFNGPYVSGAVIDLFWWVLHLKTGKAAYFSIFIKGFFCIRFLPFLI